MAYFDQHMNWLAMRSSHWTKYTLAMVGNGKPGMVREGGSSIEIRLLSDTSTGYNIIAGNS